MGVSYEEFLRSKITVSRASGFEISESELTPLLFDWQKLVTCWALRKGNAALFEGCGLGKTVQELEWAHRVCIHTRGDVLLLAPLAVAEQTKREAVKFGIPATICRSQADACNGINITNYEMLDHFDVSRFAGVVLDESSILKNHSGATRKRTTDAFAATPYRLACTATPAPNDYMELGTHAEFLGVMKRSEMLAMFFTHDGGDTSKWRLKGHAESAFWKWVCSWAVMIEKPSDIGDFSDARYVLPPLFRHQHTVTSNVFDGEMLVAPTKLTLSERRKVRRVSLRERVARCAELVNASDEQWLVWCELDDESVALAAAIPGAVEVKGPDSRAHKIQTAIDFVSGKIRVVVTKLSIWGFGLNLQNCRNQALVGLSDSFEQIFQGERRSWRFGQTRDVHVHIITSDGDGPVVRNIERKEQAYARMVEEMVQHMKAEMQREVSAKSKEALRYKTDERSGQGWTLRLGDCVSYAKLLADDSIDFTLFSPPFSSLYVYSDSIRDMGNSLSDEHFLEHFGYLIGELYRATRAGRIVAFHCMNIPAMKEKDGYIGLKDFRGDLIRAFEARGFIYHSEHVIRKDPLVEVTRTKAIGLMHKQLCKDSAMCRAGLPDYLIAMRKPGVNSKPIAHPYGLTGFAGINPPTTGTLSHERWRRYADAIWDDIDQSDTLNQKAAREGSDERHIAPLQLDVIERCLTLWSAEDDLVLDPFSGIGSTGYKALKMGRRFLGFELKPSYFEQASRNLAQAEKDAKEQYDLFANLEQTA